MFSGRTGYGKSIVFQSIPLLADLLLDQVIGTSTVVVVCPLTALMLDQVNKMNDLGINAAAVFQGQAMKLKMAYILLFSHRLNPCWLQNDGIKF